MPVGDGERTQARQREGDLGAQRIMDAERVGLGCRCRREQARGHR
ncbi:hypothetical protein [Amycolatopsis sp. NBC_00438]